MKMSKKGREGQKGEIPPKKRLKGRPICMEVGYLSSYIQNGKENGGISCTF